jgi:hypothetical protein
MPARPSHLPHNLERSALQTLRAKSGLSLEKLHPAGRQTVAGMLAKGWIAREVDVRSGARYCITPAGEAALKAQIPPGSARDKRSALEGCRGLRGSWGRPRGLFFAVMVR